MESLRNQFLIAMPSMQDPNFSRTVTLVCQHGAEGALGIVINRPTQLNLGEVLEQMHVSGGDPASLDRPVFHGGPVQMERGFVIHDGPGWESTLVVGEDLALTTSQDVLAAIAGATGPRHYLVALGYAGWGAGQLEHEISQNAWLNGPANTQLIFETPADGCWEAATRHLGVDPALLSSEAGHA
ncbi:MAG: YqgE/AlgH family protein [Gammaproteobacteria bacterium]|nr:YqgE/AlgH family protein [Gammaproteobacteria bacterium]